MPELAKLQKKIGITFSDTSVLDTALVHSSYINERPGSNRVSNERLEFLGDAVLDLVIAEKLYQAYPESDEGALTRLRAALVREATLYKVAQSIELGEHLYLGVGEESGGGRDKPANLAGALEALIAAIYLDKGLEAARGFILHFFCAEIDKQARQGSGTDFKSRLQEIIQSRHQTPPEYNLIRAIGPDHAKEFTIEVRLGETVLGKGTGKSKKAAEMEAAREALEKLQEQ